ncbi:MULTISPECIES: hypothetical protein [unclassified Mesorhizobium]|uniref:hypothetical protein n=1 Tax=unclassified Mesorhizobium TaxID=325217 RepID=UPI003334A8F0
MYNGAVAIVLLSSTEGCWKMVVKVLALVAASLFSTAVEAGEHRLGNWNVQTLVHSADTATVFPDDHHRTAADFADLRKWRDLIAADVMFLQEVTSPAAINEVFPVANGWTHCISGQYAVLEHMNQSGPVCTRVGETPHMPVAAERQQFTAIALKESAGLVLDMVADLPELNVKSDDNGTIRDVRWGLDVILRDGASRLRVLVVHLKSGCFDDRVDRKFFTRDPALDPPAKFACDTLGRQMFPLHKWIRAREDAGEAWMIVGDFNRRLDLGGGRTQDEVWTALTAFAPNRDGLDQDNRPDTLMMRQPYKEASLCWLEKRNAMPASLAEQDEYFFAPIEFFLYGAKVGALVTPASGGQVPWPNAQPKDNVRLSDHCPDVLNLKLE